MFNLILAWGQEPGRVAGGQPVNDRSEGVERKGGGGPSL